MSSKAVRTTICVPTIGRSDFLSSLALSIAEQTRDDFEVLVLDNAAPPGAVERLHEWAGQDSRVRILRSEVRLPMFANFNRGVAAATTDYVAFCHDDDCIQPRFVEQHVSFMDRNGSVGFAGSNYDIIDRNDAIVDKSRVIRSEGIWRGRDYIVTLMRSVYNPLTMQSIFFRASVLRARGFDEGLSPHFGDFVVLMRMAETTDVGHLVESLVRVRQHEGQTSASFPLSEGEALRVRFLDAYRHEYAARWPADIRRIRSMKAGLRSASRRALLRGWLEPLSHEEACACLEVLGHGLLDRALYTALDRVDRWGVSAHRRRHWAAAARRIRRAFRLAIAER